MTDDILLMANVSHTDDNNNQYHYFCIAPPPFGYNAFMDVLEYNEERCQSSTPFSDSSSGTITLFITVTALAPVYDA